VACDQVFDPLFLCGRQADPTKGPHPEPNQMSRGLSTMFWEDLSATSLKCLPDEFNRQPRLVKFAATHSKHTVEAHFNRQLFPCFGHFVSVRICFVAKTSSVAAGFRFQAARIPSLSTPPRNLSCFPPLPLWYSQRGIRVPPGGLRAPAPARPIGMREPSPLRPATEVKLCAS